MLSIFTRVCAADAGANAKHVARMIAERGARSLRRVELNLIATIGGDAKA